MVAPNCLIIAEAILQDSMKFILIHRVIGSRGLSDNAKYFCANFTSNLVEVVFRLKCYFF